MTYTKEVIQYFYEDDTREQEDLIDQLEQGAFHGDFVSYDEKEIKKLIEALRSDSGHYTQEQFQMLKEINHIGAKIILAYHLEDQ